MNTLIIRDSKQEKKERADTKSEVKISKRDNIKDTTIAIAKVDK